MKEKIKNIVKNKYFRIIIKFFIWFLLLLILSFILVAIYSFTFEKDKIDIDRYNFKQLEKVKIILKDYKKEDSYFNNVKQFNEIYNTDIRPIKNCYDISNYNWKFSYIFWFKLESLIYIYIYGTDYYAYPKYDIPYQNLCLWFFPHWTESTSSWGCFDWNRRAFENIISEPCKE